MPEKNLLLEGESKDVRDVLLAERYGRQGQKKYIDPYVMASAVFFSILIAFVVMLMIIILVILKQGFSGLSLSLQ